jgi:hypothetical protein
VSYIRADGKRHWKTEYVQRGRNHPSSAHPEKTSDDADAESQNNQPWPKNRDASVGMSV